jgi:hypothetical protein
MRMSWNLSDFVKSTQSSRDTFISKNKFTNLCFMQKSDEYTY